ncbi:MAG: sensor histidine kinase [Candidatus Limnocylindrales bacterium]
MATTTERLLVATRRRLFLVTFGLVALLVVSIGVVTAVAGLRALDADVDRALEASAAAGVARAEGGLPAPSEGGETEEAPAAADTFLLYLDAGGKLVANPSGVALSGLPDEAAVAATAANGRDLRTVDAGGVPVRLLTLPVTGSEEGGATSSTVGYVQAGFVLTLHDRQSASLVGTIALVALLGLAGAALVTLFVTGRALVPIRRSFEAQRRFVADASHELRTPAALIRANAEVLEREALVGAEGRPLVEDIVGEADRLGRLVGDLLTLASSDATPLVVEHRPVDLAEIARETVRRTAAFAAGRELRLELVPAEPAPVLGDADRLMQLLLILVDNALDHSPAGGTVTLEVERAAGVVELRVTDEGPGVPAAERERIFEPFASLAGAARDRSGGSGLGLAIARRIAVAHDGRIAVSDGPHGGARFSVTLPGARA